MKNHYATLGITSQAEDVVVRAAYKALAQRYHPDKYAGPLEEANRRMAEIAEAYAVLSDTEKRKLYDERVNLNESSEQGSFDSGDTTADEGTSQVNQDWMVALEYYPDLDGLESNLAKTSKRLAFMFRLLMLDRREFQNRRKIAIVLHREFLSNYFGSKPEIIDFAQVLINADRRDAARALNEAVRILGPDLDSALVIHKIKGRFGLLESVRPVSRKESQGGERSQIREQGLAALKRHGISVEECGMSWSLTNTLGGVRELVLPNEIKQMLKWDELNELGFMHEDGFHDSMYFFPLKKNGLVVTAVHGQYTVKNDQGVSKVFSSFPSFRSFTESYWKARKGKVVCSKCGAINPGNFGMCLQCHNPMGIK